MPISCSASCLTFEFFTTVVEWIAHTKLTSIPYLWHLLGDFLFIAPLLELCQMQLDLFLSPFLPAILDKNVKKNALVYLILEYFPLKPGSLRYFPSPAKKTMLKDDRNIFGPDLNTDQGGVGGGATMKLNSPCGSTVSNKV